MFGFLRLLIFAPTALRVFLYSYSIIFFPGGSILRSLGLSRSKYMGSPTRTCSYKNDIDFHLPHPYRRHTSTTLCTFFPPALSNLAFELLCNSYIGGLHIFKLVMY